MRGSGGTQRGDRWSAVSLGHSGSRKEPKMLARSCDQLCPITADHMTLMISVAPEVPPVSAHQCPSVPRASAHHCHINATYQYIPVHINATYQCPSELPFNVTHQCHLSVLPISATYQCQSVSPISASQCRLSVPVSAAYRFHSVPPNSASQCHLSV
ncbi:unnamed protein product, partial [Staurois parvus]